MPKLKKLTYYYLQKCNSLSRPYGKIHIIPTLSRVTKKSVGTSIKEIFTPMLLEGLILPYERVNFKGTYKLANCWQK